MEKLVVLINKTGKTDIMSTETDKNKLMNYEGTWYKYYSEYVQRSKYKEKLIIILVEKDMDSFLIEEFTKEIPKIIKENGLV